MELKDEEWFDDNDGLFIYSLMTHQLPISTSSRPLCFCQHTQMVMAS